MTCQEVLGHKIQQHKEWLSVETWHKIQVRKEKKSQTSAAKSKKSQISIAKVKAQKQYAEASKEMKKSVKADKRNYIDSLTEEAEQAGASGNLKMMYDTTKKLSSKYSKPERPVKDKEGKVVQGTEQ